MKKALICLLPLLFLVSCSGSSSSSSETLTSYSSSEASITPISSSSSLESSSEDPHNWNAVDRATIESTLGGELIPFIDVGLELDVKDVDGDLLITSKEKGLQAEMIPPTAELFDAAGWSNITTRYSNLPYGNRAYELITDNYRIEVRMGAALSLPPDGELDPEEGFTRGEGYFWLYGTAPERMKEFPLQAIYDACLEYCGVASYTIPEPSYEGVEEYRIYPTSSIWSGRSAVALLIDADDFRACGNQYYTDLVNAGYIYSESLGLYVSPDGLILIGVGVFNNECLHIQIENSLGFRGSFPSSSEINNHLFSLFMTRNTIALPIPNDEVGGDLYALGYGEGNSSLIIIVFAFGDDPLTSYANQLVEASYSLQEDGSYLDSSSNWKVTLEVSSSSSLKEMRITITEA